MRATRILVPTLFLLFTLAGVAQESTTDPTLAGLVRQALAYHPDVKAGQQGALRSAYRVKSARSQYLPTVNGVANYHYITPVAEVLFPAGPGGELRQFQFQPHHNVNAAVTISQVIWDFGKGQAGIEKARSEAQLSQDEVQSLEHQLAYQVAALYYSIAYLQKAIGVQKSLLNLLLENERIIASRIANGDEIDYTLVATQVRTKQIEIRLIDLQNQLDKQEIALSHLTGEKLPGSADTRIQFQLPAADTLQGGPYSATLAANWDLKLARGREKVAEYELNSASRSHYPSLVFNGAAGFRNGYQPDIAQIRENLLVGATLNVPIYNGNRLRQQTSIARTSVEMAQYATQARNLAMQTSLEQTTSEIQAATGKLERTGTQVAQAEYAVKLGEARYRNGVITNLEVLSAQSALEEALLSRLQVEYQLTLATLELSRLQGLTFW